MARVARNFGVHDLVLVAPRAPIAQEARRRAMVGLNLLKSARTVPDFAAAVKVADLVIGTTDLSTGRSTAYLRRSVSPERLAEVVRPLQGRIALVFGPEDNGLGRSELAQCDLLVHIPARREAPTLNLSHAVAVVLYALHRARGTDDADSTPAPEVLELHGPTKELFLTRVAALAQTVGYPAHKRRGLVLLFRRAFGRGTPTEAEYRLLLGFVKSLDRVARRSAHGRA